MTAPTCRHCHAPLDQVFVDLGHAPPSNAYLSPDALQQPELTFPLRVLVCGQCFLVQTQDFADADALFTEDYAYFSSTSRSWLAHAKRYTDTVSERFGLGANSFVVELASNDGYLLKNFVERGVPCLGIEPTESTATAAEQIGVPTRQVFFDLAVAQEMVAQGEAADLVIGNNVYAHVPDINGFTQGIAHLLKPNGVVTLEFPQLLRLIEFGQFDTIYHEHFSYLSLSAVSTIFEAAGLRVFDVEELTTHGGSLRVFGCRSDAAHPTNDAVAQILSSEAEAGLLELSTYAAFQTVADRIKNDALRFLLDCAAEGKSVAGYGAAAKGNTLLNYGGVRPDLLPFVCDAAAAKQGKHLPGSHIPILPPDALRDAAPDYVLILPWNIAAEIKEQFADLAAKGTRFVTFVPNLVVHE